jgi:inhibitor of KinA sporulation pathway (predicted exonuclease)
MNFIIVDLEATCWEEGREGQNEIIEIGAVKINQDQKTLDEFQCFVKPLKHPLLSDFCKNLTSINQQDVDQAGNFDKAISQFQDWIGSDYLLCSWGFYDKKQFQQDCKLWGLDSSWTEPHISLKHQYGRIRGLKRNPGMKRALGLEGISLEGTHHRGIDDARNIAQIFLRHFEKWQF